MTTVGDGFSIPPQSEKKPRNPRKKAEPKAASKLIEALDFVGHACDMSSAFSWMHHVRFVNKWVVATNGTMRAGSPVEEDLTLCPHLGHLKAALTRAGASVALSALDSGRLSIGGAGGKLKVIVPCAPGDSLPPVMVDNNIAPISDRIKDGFKAVLSLAKDEAERLVEATLLLRANSVVGCNGDLALEYWHGVDLPPGLNIPQAFAKAVSKVAKPLTGFGWTEGRSVTFYFEDGSWMATQLGEGQWPDIDRVLNVPTHNLEDVPKTLFEALDAIASFSPDGAVHFHDGKLKTTYGAYEDAASPYGATYDVPELKSHHSFSARLFKLAQPAAAKFDYTTHEDRVVFYNQDAWLRGVLTKRIG